MGSGLMPEAGFDSQIFPAVLAIWAAGAIWLLGNWIVRQTGLLAEIRRGRLLLSGREYCQLVRLKRKLKIRRRIRLVTSDEFTEIGVFGIWKPWILLPEAIAEDLTDSELEAILLHELIHIARWDNLLSHLSMFACCVFWFHPLVWLADRKLLAERERVCDDRVIELGSASRTYAASLVKVLRFGIGFRVAGVSCAGGPHLKHRIESIASGLPAPRVRFIHRLAIWGALLSLLVGSLAAVKLDRCEVDISLKNTAVQQPKPDCH
jgi:beta-lactamase regulating signal transducer with metallopeptidase domain